MDLTYEYFVNGKKYMGKRFALNGNPTAVNEEMLYKKIMKLSDGGLVKVYYESANHESAVLYPGEM